MGKRPTDNGVASDLVNMNLDNVIVLLLVVLATFSIGFNVGLLRIVCGFVFMLVLPGYAVINVFDGMFKSASIKR